MWVRGESRVEESSDGGERGVCGRGKRGKMEMGMEMGRYMIEEREIANRREECR